MTVAGSVDALVEALCGDLTRIRAPRGTELHARSWQTEAPLRMLLNNLDPEVAEHPESLVVYGGSGKAARDHDSLKALVRTLLRLGDDETMLVQSGKPVGVFRTHAQAPRVLISNAMLVPRWATWDEFRQARGARADDVRPDDRGQLDLHRHPGNPPGDVPDVRGRGRAALRPAATCAGGRCSRRASAAWAARSRSPPRCSTAPSSASRSIRLGSSGGSRRTISTRRRSRSTRRSRSFARRRVTAAGCRWGSSAMRPTSCPSWRAAASTSISSQTRRPRTTRSPATCRRGSTSRRRLRSGRRIRRSTCGGRARPSRSTSAACSSTSGRAAMFSIMATTSEVRPVKPA